MQMQNKRTAMTLATFVNIINRQLHPLISAEGPFLVGTNDNHQLSTTAMHMIT
jgi:hypothetical protein